MTRLADQERSRRLRAQGWSLRQIAKEVDASLGSVSVWVRNVPQPAPSKAPVIEKPPPPTFVGTKHCPRCCEELPLTSFNRSGTGHQGWCRECFRVYLKNRGQLHIDQTVAAKRRRVVEARGFLLRYLLDKACADCGISDNVVLEFDHRGEKRGSIAALAGEGLSIRGLAVEVERCDVVCVNCHRRRTAHAFGWRRIRDDWRTAPCRLTRRERANVDFAYETLERAGCADCGTHDLCVLDFDHVGVKTGRVVQMAWEGYGRARIVAEIEQCVVRCGNCHRRRTAVQLGHYRADSA